METKRLVITTYKETWAEIKRICIINDMKIADVLKMLIDNYKEKL